MSRRPLLFLFNLLVVTMAVAGCAGTGGEVRLCEHIYLREGRLKLDRNEKVLVCGAGQDGGEGWREVPLAQAQYQIKVLLQNQGYLHPRFERRADILDVWSGPLETAARFEVNGADGLLDPVKKREVIGQPLTPAMLDEIKRWADSGLRARGYACPRIDVRAEAWNRAVIADIEKGSRLRVGKVLYSGLDGLDPETMARYQAFQAGDWYDVRDTQVTVARLLADGLFQSAYFINGCHDGRTDLSLVTSIGKPRIFRFGVGASTEEFPFARAWYKNARLDSRASSFTASVYASSRTQSLDVSSALYHVPWSRRAYFGPRFFAAREYESAYEVTRAKLGADLGRMWDWRRARLQARLGPTLNYVNTVQGIGPQALSFLSWEGSLTAMNRAFELYSRDQYEGWMADLEYRGQRRGVGSPINVDRYEVNYKYLWNVAGYAPPLFVLGSRLQAVGVGGNPVALGENRDVLPVDYRVFYGGDQNLRGFNRQSLDNQGYGYLTALYLGFELRLVEELPYRLEPFLLFDSAQLGNRRFTLDAPLFTSQGMGLRWASPFGTLRGSAARGRIFHEDQSTQGYPQEWVFFLSFGQEF